MLTISDHSGILDEAHWALLVRTDAIASFLGRSTTTGLHITQASNDWLTGGWLVSDWLRLFFIFLPVCMHVTQSSDNWLAYDWLRLVRLSGLLTTTRSIDHGGSSWLT